MRANRIISRFIKVLDDLDKKGEKIPGLILSHPGFGKTSTIRKYCEYMDYNLIAVIPSQSSSDDIVGLQSIRDGKLIRLTPSWYNKLVETAKNGKRTLLFLDEISAVDSYIQGPLLDLIFSHSLGEASLPNNVFIMAAGNYNADLNNAFGMTAPLVNRFMILNLWNKDYSVEELLNDSFESVKTKEEIGHLLGLEEEGGGVYDLTYFKEWIQEKGEISFGKSICTEDPDYGLMGFTSVRSLTYSLKFMEAYTSIYSDPFWMRTVGDTLGISEKREGKLMRVILEANAHLFSKKSAFYYRKGNKMTLASVCDEVLKKGNLEEEDLNKLETIINNISSLEISSTDLKKFTMVVSKSFDNERIRKMNSIITDKMQF
jgi:hypothetical protein